MDVARSIDCLLRSDVSLKEKVTEILESPSGVDLMGKVIDVIRERCENVTSNEWDNVISNEIESAHKAVRIKQWRDASSAEYNDWFQARWEIIEELACDIKENEIAKDTLSSMVEFLTELQDERCCIEDQIFAEGVEHFVRFLKNTIDYCSEHNIYHIHRALIHGIVSSLRVMYDGRPEKNIQNALKQLEDVC